MPDEKKTEEIVRNHFNKYSSDIIIEQQKSENPRIKKCLQKASKGGDGKGYPDFIISIKNHPDLLIVIECKADWKKHETKNHDSYVDFAVDGSLYYASHLNKQFDVISIGISGEEKNKLNVTNYLCLRSFKKEKVFSNKLLDIDSYVDGYEQNPQKFNQDYVQLLAYAKILNKNLQKNKISANYRSLLIGSIIIALENKPFTKSYKSVNKPKALAELVINSAINELENAGLIRERLENLITQFSFIKTERSLSKKENYLKNLIIGIEENIFTFKRTHKYTDTMTAFYIEFLRYANKDKAMGIVLTPPHITELFTELAEVSKQSVVFDNCAGTGGFLISAMKKMVLNAQNDKQAIKRIKSKQLIGIEEQSNVYALLISNLFIHQDGKTNIVPGNCFDQENINFVKKFKPNVGLLNPPYKSDKKDDIEELDFVLNNLECLEPNSLCVGLLPMQSSISTDGEILQLKKKILESHTLKAVLSLPDQLFHGSANVVSCAMVFIAHKPHNFQKNVFFGYFKDDGFEIKKKFHGRADCYNKWQDIKKKWLDLYLNEKIDKKLSVLKKIKVDDEWSAEKYLTFELQEDEFYKKLDKNILDYVTYLFSNKLLTQAYAKTAGDKNFELDIKNWKSIKLQDLFEISGSKTTPKEELNDDYGEGDYPFITTQATNNSVEGFYNYFTEEGKIITVDSAVLGYAAYQKLNFSASDHVEKLTPKFKMNELSSMFFTTLINTQQFRFNYGRKASQDRLKNLVINVPVLNKNKIFDINDIDLDLIEKIVGSRNYSYNLDKS